MLSYKLVNTVLVILKIVGFLIAFLFCHNFLSLSLSITIFPLYPPSFSVSGPGQVSVAWALGQQGQGKGLWGWWRKQFLGGGN